MGSDIAELLERVEAASGPDRELDAAIEVAMLGTTATDDDLIYHSVPRKDDHCAPGTFWRKSRSGASLRTAAPFTASLDNALALVEEKLPRWNAFEVQHTDAYDAQIWWMRGEQEVVTDTGPACATPALAIVSCLLRALAPVPGTDSNG